MKLLVTRPALDAGPLAELLTAAGHTVLVDPLLEIRFRDRAVLDLDGVTGLLFTSGNGARAFAALSERRDIPAYTVGDRTATLARDCGFERVESADGDVATLAELVRARRAPADGTLLHVSGHETVGELAQRLEAAGYAVRRAVLYDAEPAADLAPATRTALGTGTLDGVLLFSPRTARHFAALTQLSGLSARVHGLTAWCLSPAVADALGNLKLAQIHVAAEPTQAALLSLVSPAPSGAARGPAVAEVPRPKEDVVTDTPPRKTPPADTTPPQNKSDAGKAGRIEPTIAASLPADPAPPEATEAEVAYVAPFPFEMPDADAAEAPPPSPGPAKARSRRSPLVVAGILVLIIVGAAALFAPQIKEKLQESGFGGGSPAPAREAATETPAPGGPTLHAGGVADNAPSEAPSGPPVMMPAHEPPGDGSPTAAPSSAAPETAPETSTAASTPSTPAAEPTTESTTASGTTSAPAPDAGPTVPGNVAARLDAAEARLDRLLAAAPPAGTVAGLQQSVAGLGQRLAGLEARPAADPASVQAVAADLRRVSANLADAANRIARLEQQMQQQAAAQRNEKATVLALAELKDRLAGSGPFDGPV
ncbi:MAG TPA: uroporphyrinogen-III synthase, partial [Aliidongia sp.]|nr:uroporphyrinogen-III synthase [Aliidongia sp.]